jgi:AraC-like DNA-binding protein
MPLQPTQLKFSDFDLFRLEEGVDVGKLCLSLQGLFTDKSCKISMDNPALRNEEGFHTTIKNDRDPFTTVNLFQGIKKHFPTDWAGTILRRSAPIKVLKKRQKELGAGAFIPSADLTDWGKFGANYISSTVIKEIAHRCGFTNPEKCTAAGRHAAGITNLVSSGTVSTAQIQTSARHKSAVTNIKYQEWDTKAQAQRHKAQQYDPTAFNVSD